MTEKFFKEKIEILHFGQGIPYTEIGRRIGVTGQYISLIMKGNKPVTKSLLEKAEQSEIFKENMGILITSEEYERVMARPEEIRAISALILIRRKFEDLTNQAEKYDVANDKIFSDLIN